MNFAAECRGLGFALRLIAFVGLVAVGQYASWSVFPELIGPSHLVSQTITRAPAGSIFYFGDSTTFAAASDEENVQDMAQIIAEYHPELNIVPDFRAATSVRTFSALLEARLREGIVPSCVIMDIHLASFSDVWFFAPTIHEKRGRYIFQSLAPWWQAWLRPAKVFKLTASMSFEEYARLPIYWKGERIGRYGNIRDEAIAKKDRRRLWPCASLLVPARDSRLFPYWTEFFALVEQHDIPVVLYFTPMNYQVVHELVGEGALEIMEANRDVLTEKLEREGVSLIDMMFEFDKSYFHSARLDQHLRYKGRKHVALRVAQEVARVLAEHPAAR